MPFPAEVSARCIVIAQALVAFGRNSHSVPPGLGGTQVTVTHRLRTAEVAIATISGAIIARHHRAPAAPGRSCATAGT